MKLEVCLIVTGFCMQCLQPRLQQMDTSTSVFHMYALAVNELLPPRSVRVYSPKDCSLISTYINGAKIFEKKYYHIVNVGKVTDY